MGALTFGLSPVIKGYSTPKEKGKKVSKLGRLWIWDSFLGPTWSIEFSPPAFSPVIRLGLRDPRKKERRKYIKPLPIHISGDLDFGACDLRSMVSNYLFVPGRSQEPKVRIFRNQII